MTEPTMRILSLGAGVQSTALLLLSAKGELPLLDAAIFADTGSEPAVVYDHLDRLEAEVARPAGIPIHRVSYGNLGDDLLDPDRMAMIPAYSRGWETVRTATKFTLCSCGWARFREMGKDFDLFAMVPGGATLEEVQDLAAAPPRNVDGDLIEDPEVAAEYTDMYQQVASAMSFGLFDRLPDHHEACKSLGRIPIEWREELVETRGMLGRKCTQQYKLRPLLEQVRLLLGAATSETPCERCEATGRRVAPWRAKRGEGVVGSCSVCKGTGVVRLVQQPPTGRWAEQWIGFSTDELSRVSGKGDTRYSRSVHPLLTLGMSREQCIAYLNHNGWASVAKSACTFCPYHGNREWRQMRNTDPQSWKEAVAFDEAYRVGAGMKGERFLHASCKPLGEATIDIVRPSENEQLDILDAAFKARLEEGDPDGCSPWGCRSGEPIAS